MTRNTHIIHRIWRPQALVLKALVLVALAAMALSQAPAAEAKSKRLPFTSGAAVVLANLPLAPLATPAKARFGPKAPALGVQTPRSLTPTQNNAAPVWLASNVDSAYLAGVREGRYASLKVIKSAIQAFTGVIIKRVLSIDMNQGVLALTVEDVYSNIFTVNVQPETAQVLQ